MIKFFFESKINSLQGVRWLYNRVDHTLAINFTRYRGYILLTIGVEVGNSFVLVFCECLMFVTEEVGLF